MPEARVYCVKCQAAMEPGFIADVTYGQVLQTAWSPGIPQMRRFIGGIKLKPKGQVPLTAYRCAGCGYVEFYAVP